MISTEPLAFEEAWEFARKKQLLPTSLSSAELRGVREALKRRAVFSARMTLGGFLDKLKTQVELASSGTTDEHGRLRSTPEAKAQLREWLVENGYSPTPGEEGTIKDFLSDKRLQLVVETNVLDTMSYGRWRAGQDEVALDVNPGWRLVRMVQSRVQRDWSTRWAAAGGSVGWAGAHAESMVALKTSPIWQALGAGAGGYQDTLGNPWPPFAFNSGMNVVSVPRAECEELGLIAPGEMQVPQAAGLNDGLEASAGNFAAELQAALAADPDLRMEDGVLRLAVNARRGVGARDARQGGRDGHPTRARVEAFLEITEVAA